MRIHRNHLGTRIIGTGLGCGFILIGLYAIFGAGEGVDDYARGRSMAFGATAIIGGLWAIGASWLEERQGEIWCAHPPRGIWRRRSRF